MSNTEMTPLPGKIQRLLEQEQARPGPTPAAEERVMAGVIATMGLPPGPGGGGAGGGSSAGGAGVAGAAGSVASSSSIGQAAAAGVGAGVGPLAAIIKPATLTALALGIAIGTGGTYTLMRDRGAEVPLAAAVQQDQPTERAATPESQRAVGGVEQLAVTPVKAPELAPARVEVKQPKSKRTAARPAKVEYNDGGRQDAARDRSAKLAAERSLVEMSRTALSRGRASDALKHLTDHRQRFPQGHLVEEREALTVLAMIAMGRVDHARVLAGRFRVTYAKSMLLSTVEAALRRASAEKR